MLPVIKAMNIEALRVCLYESLMSVQSHNTTKQSIREAHRQQRERRDSAEREWLRPRLKRVIGHFAESSEVDIRKTSPVLAPVRASTWGKRPLPGCDASMVSAGVTWVR